MTSILNFGLDFQQNSIRYGEVEDGEEGEGELKKNFLKKIFG
jgi:hypothetical protein